ncbi:MAG TPA: hypothetical protein VGI15_05590, partial [Candidatus Cybelea sp.]
DGAEQGASNEHGSPAKKQSPEITEVHLSLISGTSRDISLAIFRLAPKSGWSIASDSPKLQVSIVGGDEALLQASQDEKEHAKATATITHDDGTTFLVRCHIEPC